VEATCQVAVEVRDYYGVRITPDEPCGAPIPRLCGAGGCRHRRSDHDETEIYNVVTPVCYGAQRDGVPCDIAHLYTPGSFASECTRGYPVAVPSETERRG
jgi:hypothetical protein